MMGLILKDVFKTWNISDSRGAIILTTTSSVSMTLGLLVGPLIRRYGFRLVAAAGGVMSASGMALTSRATNFYEFILFYSIIMAIGMSLSYPSYIVALNTYFTARRTLATAVALFFTGITSIILPQLIRAVSAHYGPRPAMLVLSGIALQSLVAAALLRPLPSPTARHGVASKDEEAVIEQSAAQEGGAATPMLAPTEDSDGLKASGVGKVEEKTQKSTNKGIVSVLVALFDLELLRDPVFLNLVLGTSLGIFADINLLQFLPFILDGRGFGTGQIAVFMSVLSCADTASRLAAPLLHRKCRLSSRVMFLATMVVLMATRTALMWCRSYTSVMAAVSLVGASRGVHVVFLQTVIPDNVAVARLPSAQGIYMATNGVLFMAVGSFTGWLIGRAKDYSIMFLVLLAMNIITIVMWCTEFAVRALRSRCNAKAGL